MTNSTTLVTSSSCLESLTYHRIVSPTLLIPTEPSTPVPVGLLACQRDPFLRHLETNVISCTRAQNIEAPKDKKKKTQSSYQQGPLYEVLLQDTVLFPEGGGQPSDIGHIRSADGATWDVLEVKRHGGLAIHYVKGDDTGVSVKTLASGVRVTVSLGENGFKRRYDHMCMHTSQHLISALLETRLGLPTPSWYLTQSPNPAYVEVPRAPTAAELKEIEDTANDYCSRGTRLHIEVEELGTAERNNQDGNTSKGLPADYTGGVNRTVVIDGVDRNPCCGTHLPTLQGISIFILPQTESLSRGRARIYFCAGPRVQAYLSQTHALLAAAAGNYGCSPAQVPERLAFEVDSRRKSHKRVEELEKEVAASVVNELLAERSQWEKSGKEGRFTAFRHRHDSSPNPLSILTTVQSAWSFSPGASNPFLIVLISSELLASSNNAVVLVFGSDEKEVKEIGESLKSKGIKGGGKRTWSGKTENWKAVGGDRWIIDLLRLITVT